MKFHQHNASHLTKMAAMPIYGKNTVKSSFQEQLGTTRLILMKLCMKHQRPKPFIFCSNYDHKLTLTYYDKVKFCNLGFYIGICDDGFFGLLHSVTWNLVDIVN